MSKGPSARRSAAEPPPAIELKAGRTLSIGDQAGDDLVEVRGADGGIEVRIVLTDKGPVLQMESVRLSLRAADAIDVETGSFRVRTTDELALSSAGDIRVAGDADVLVNADGEVRVVGTMIWLN